MNADVNMAAMLSSDWREQRFQGKNMSKHLLNPVQPRLAANSPWFPLD